MLAEKIKKTFLDFRNLLKKYEQNIEVVDPQLKNNVELVEILVDFWKTSRTHGLKASHTLWTTRNASSWSIFQASSRQQERSIRHSLSSLKTVKQKFSWSYPLCWSWSHSKVMIKTFATSSTLRCLISNLRKASNFLFCEETMNRAEPRWGAHSTIIT